MKILIAIDDTDNLESRGTGEIASLIAEDLQQRGWGSCSFVSRHQLFVHPDIPYTSHNSAMCFFADIGEGRLEPVIELVGAFLERESAEGSDPGLCVAVPGAMASARELSAFGRRAKQEVVTMEEAYQLAHRLRGNDGRLKGSLEFAHPYRVLRVGELLQHPLVDAVRCVAGGALREEDLVAIGEKPKTVLLDGASVLLVSAAAEKVSGACWQTLHRKQLRGY